VRLLNLVGVVRASRLSTYLTSHLLPRWTVPRTVTGHSVSDFMEQGVTHLCLAVEFGQDRREEDRAPRVITQPEGALAAVEGEVPVVEVVLGEQGAGKRTGGIQVHRVSLSCSFHPLGLCSSQVSAVDGGHAPLGVAVACHRSNGHRRQKTLELLRAQASGRRTVAARFGLPTGALHDAGAGAAAFSLGDEQHEVGEPALEDVHHAWNGTVESW